MVNENFQFHKIDTKEKAYCLGFILADGSIDKKNRIELTVALRDAEILDIFKCLMGGNIHIDNTFDKKAKRFPRARFQRVVKDITKFTGGALKADRHYPIIRKDLEPYMIQGFFDGGGCITYGIRKDSNRLWHKISFTSQLKMLEGVQQYLLKSANISTIVRPKTNEKCYVLEFANKSDILNFFNCVYINETFIVLKRKYLKFKALRHELEENGETLTK